MNIFTLMGNPEEIKQCLEDLRKGQNIRMGLLNVQNLPRDERREHNNMFLQCLMEVNGNSKKESLIWMKQEIDPFFYNRSLTDFNHKNKLWENIGDWIEDKLIKLKSYFKFILAECKMCLNFIKARCNISNSPSKINWSAMFKRFSLIVTTYVDLIQDSTLLVTLIYLLQGGLFTHFTTFACQVFWHLAASIVIPLLISALVTVRHHPLLILGFRSWEFHKHTPPSRRRLWGIRFLTFFFYPMVPAMLLHAREEAKQRVEDILERGKERAEMTMEEMEEVDYLSEYLKDARKALLTFKRNEFGVEMVLQLTIQTMMLLLSKTVFPTHTGLEAVFKEDFKSQYSWLGADLTVIFLAVSILRGFITSAKTYIKIKTEDKKEILSSTGKLLLGFRALLTIITRVFSFVVYFGPFLGLGDILAHWIAEQVSLDLSFRDRADRAGHYEPLPPIDIITSKYAYNHRVSMKTETVAFSTLYRSDYTDPTNPIPPGYQEYTGVTLREAWIIFCLLLVVQYVSIVVVKCKLSVKFKGVRKHQKLQHVLETLNVPDCYADWDEENGSPKEHMKRYKEFMREMVAMVVVHFLSNLVMLCPIFITGQCTMDLGAILHKLQEYRKLFVSHWVVNVYT